MNKNTASMVWSLISLFGLLVSFSHAAAYSLDEILVDEPDRSAGTVHNSTGASVTINFMTMGFYNGSSNSGNSCTGSLLGDNSISPITGSKSFPNNGNVYLNSTATYTLAQANAAGGAAATHCIDVQLSSDNGTSSFVTNVSSLPGYSVNCPGSSCTVTGAPTTVNVTTTVRRK